MQTLFGQSNRIIVHLHNQQHYIYHLAINADTPDALWINKQTKWGLDEVGGEFQRR